MTTVKILALGIDSTGAKQGADEWSRATEGVRKDAKEAGRAVDGLDKSVDKAGKGAKDAAPKIGQLDKSVDAMGKGAKSAGREVDGLAAATGKARDSSGRFVKTTDAASGGLKRFEANAGRATKNMAKLLGVFSAFAAIRNATGAIAGFEATMSELSAVTGRTGADLEALSSTARELGAATKFSAREAGEGLVFLARAGFSANDAMAAIPATLNLAAAGNIALGEAADFASNIVSQFNLQAAETARVADVLTKTSTSSNTNVRQLAEALKFAGPVAGSLGIELEQTSAALGVLGDAGIQASLAGTNLRGVLSGLLDPTTKGSRALEGMRVSLEEVSPASRDLIQIFERLNAAGLDAGDALSIFGRRNAVAALLIAGNIDKLKALTEANKAAGGAAETAARIMADNLAGGAKEFTSAMTEAVLITGDKGLLGALRSILRTGTDAIRILTGIADAQTQANTSAQVLARTVKTLGLFLAGLALIKTITLLVRFVRTIYTAVAAVRALNFATASNPIGALATALAFAVSATIGFGASIGDARHEVSRLSDATGEAILAMRDLREESAKAATAGDFSKQTAALEGQLRRIEEYRSELRRLSPGVTVPRSDLGAFVPALETLTAVEALEAFQARASGATDVPPQRLAGDSIASIDAIRLVEGAIKDLEGRIKALNAERAKSESASRGAVEAGVFEAEQRQKSVAAIEKQINALRLSRELIGKDREERERILALRKAEESAAALDEADRTKRLAALRTELDLSQKLRAEDEERRRAADLARQENEARDSAVASLERFVAGLEDQLRLARLSNDEREQTVALREAENIAAAAGISLAASEAERITALVKAQQEARREREAASSRGRPGRSSGQGPAFGPEVPPRDGQRAAQDLQRFLDGLRQETQLVGLSARERERAIGVRELERLATQAQRNDIAELTAEYLQLLDTLEQSDRVTRLADGIGVTFADAFEKAVLGAESLQDAISGLGDALAQLAFREFVTSPLSEFLSGIGGSLLGGIFESSGSSNFGVAGGLIGPAPAPNAHGNAFTGGSVIPFASGGVFDGPRLFPMSAGRTGLLGEAGPEAIMPLQRTPDGKLGVRAEGGGGVNLTFNVSVAGGDKDGMRRAVRHEAQKARKLLERAR